ncbi:MAG: T9SS type A sorting domain-containing protein [Bacteroidota bacterium]
MKKISLLFSSLCFCFLLDAQISYIEENFESEQFPSLWERSQQMGSDGWLIGDSADIATAFWHIPATNHFIASNDDVCNCDKSEDIFWMAPMSIPAAQKIFISFDAYLDGLLSANAQLIYSTDGGNSYSTLRNVPTANVWTSYTWDLGTNLSGQTIQLGFLFNDAGTWSTGVALDNIRVFPPPERDIALGFFPLHKFQEVSSLPIQINLSNQGSTSVDDITLSFFVNGSRLSQETFQSLGLVPLADTILTFASSWTPNSGTYEWEARVELVNHQPDQQSSNDSLSKFMYVANRLVAGKALVEHFTQTNCFTCAEQNPSFFRLLEREQEHAIAISYHTFWPGMNNDPMHLFNPIQQRSRIGFYGIDAVPQALIQGGFVQEGSFSGAPNGVKAEDLQQISELKSPVDIQLDFSFQQNEIQAIASAEILLKPDASNWRFFVALVQEEVIWSSPPGSNGEREFSSVFRSFLTDPEGESLDNLIQGDSLHMSWTYPIDGPLINQDLSLVGWVQDIETREVVSVSQTFLPLPNDFQEPSSLRILVHNNFLTIKGIEPNLANKHLTILDMQGKRIWSGTLAPEEETIHISSMSEGIYLLSIQVDQEVFSQKIVIQ